MVRPQRGGNEAQADKLVQYMQYQLNLLKPNPAKQRYYFRSITLVECYGSCNTQRDLAVEVKTAFLGENLARKKSYKLHALAEKAMHVQVCLCVEPKRENAATATVSIEYRCNDITPVLLGVQGALCWTATSWCHLLRHQGD